MRNAKDAQVALLRDLELLALRPRRGHDLRRTFITLAQVDGARRDLLEVVTHGPRGDIVSIYTTFPWPALCAEVAKLNIALLGRSEVVEMPQQRVAAGSTVLQSVLQSAKPPEFISETRAVCSDPNGI